MIAVPVSAERRQVTVATPDNLLQQGTPAHPRELIDHVCNAWRTQANVAPYRWEFAEDSRDFDVAVDSRVATNDMGMMVRFARSGAGLSFRMEETFRSYIERGQSLWMDQKAAEEE